MTILMEMAYDNAGKYGVEIDLIDVADDYITVFANSRSIVVYNDGTCSLWDHEGFRIKDYKRIGYCFKYLSKMDAII